ncbi:MAG: regulatory protein RecX [Eubacterium sp.]|nr:regulatory protein RecX [Eubacterium sp.]
MEESVCFPDEESKKATEKAMALLLHKDRTAWELKDRLFRAGFSEKASDFAFDYVSRYGYINDLRYATGYIDYHKTSKSRKEIRRKLKEKGIPDDVLAEAFLAYETDEDGAPFARDGDGGDGPTDPEEVALRALLAKRLKGRDVAELTYEEKQKQMRYLAGKGYPIDKIQRAFRNT